jgi:hypothetical protein
MDSVHHRGIPYHRRCFELRRLSAEALADFVVDDLG